jgi:hypothetical protein
MCAVSMVMDWGLTQPPQVWVQPTWPPGFEELLRKAQKYDEEHNQPECELDEKRQALKKIADEMGVEIRFT